MSLPPLTSRSVVPSAIILAALAFVTGCSGETKPTSAPSPTSTATNPITEVEFIDLEAKEVVVAPGNSGPSYVVTVVNHNPDLSIYSGLLLTSLDDNDDVIESNPLPGGVFSPGETVMVFDTVTWGLDSEITNPGIEFKSVERNYGHELFTGAPYTGNTYLEVANVEKGESIIGNPRIGMDIVSTLNVGVQAEVDVVIRDADDKIVFAANAASRYVPAGNRSITLGQELTNLPQVPKGGEMDFWPRITGPDQSQQFPASSTLTVEDPVFGGYEDQPDEWEGMIWATAKITNTGDTQSTDNVIFRFFDDSGAYLGEITTDTQLIEPGEVRRVTQVGPPGQVLLGVTQVEVATVPNGRPIDTEGGNVTLENVNEKSGTLSATAVSTLPTETTIGIYVVCWREDGSPNYAASMFTEPIGAHERKPVSVTPAKPADTDHCTLEVTAYWENLDYEWRKSG